jgi:hypothetical protein
MKNYSLLLLISPILWHPQPISVSAQFSQPVAQKIAKKNNDKTLSSIQEKTKNPQQFLCSNQNIENLTTYLMRDLPSYSNRITQRSRRLSRKVDVFSYMLVAGRPEFTPLKVDNTDVPENSAEGVEQIFFTTLERQYTRGTPIELQQYHRLLLTKSTSGWRMVMMLSQTGSYPAKNIPSPPRESSRGNVAQAVETWLRDCRADSIKIQAVNPL